MHEIVRLPAGPDLSRVAPSLCVDFPVVPLPGARVAWLNAGWWHRHGLDVSSPSVRRDIEDDLVRAFGVTAGDPSGCGARLAADRYGGSLGAVHGGSGRCGSVGGLSAKGVGRTPLVAVGRVGDHCDGRLPMAEALREAVCAEIAAAELPHGAVPAVAILQTGEEDGAILVRPNFVRPAHFERSIYFGTAGFEGSDQQLDAMRVKEMVRVAEVDPDALDFPGLTEMLTRFALQIGASRSRRLWQGKFLSSNAAVTGATADFGSFRGVPSWHGFFGLPEERFGGEQDYLILAADSLARSFRKNGSCGGASLPTLISEEIPATIARGFAEDVIRSLGLAIAGPAARRSIVESLQSLWRVQQRRKAQIAYAGDQKLPWIDAALTGQRPSDTLEAEERVIEALLEAAAADGSLDPLDVLSRLNVWAAPRSDLTYENSSVRFAEAAKRAARSAEPSILLGDVIDDALSASLRRPDCVPRGWAVQGQSVGPGCSALYLRTHDGSLHSVLVTATSFNGRARAFDRLIACPIDACSEQRWQIECASDAAASGANVDVEGVDLALPPAKFTYPQPAARWTEPFLGKRRSAHRTPSYA